jgi:DNA-binding protein HU-beta
MNKQELVAAAAALAGQDKKQFAEAVNAILATIQAELSIGGEVRLTGFGTFRTADRPAKSGYSALAGRVVDTPAKTVPVFKAGDAFKAAVNGTTAKAA